MSRTRAPHANAVIVGMGWAGSIVASELTKAGLSVVGLERGPDRPDGDSVYSHKHDELRFKVRQDMMQDTSAETWTFRHNQRQQALPLRYLGAFCPASGVGGSTCHYGGLTARIAPWEFETRSRIVERYGVSAIPRDASLEDWPLSYADLEPYYDRFETAVGVSGEAGNLNGILTDRGNPFEGPRRRPFPLPPVKVGEGVALAGAACEALGYHPYPSPSAILSRDYTNPDGIERRACTYCGDCSFHVCAVGAKGDARDVFVPVARRSDAFSLRPDSYVFQISHDGRRATGVLYHDADGNVVEQTADIVVLSAYTFNNVRLLLLSGMGQPYDPERGTGVVGKNYAYQVMLWGFGFFEGRKFRNYMGSAAGLIVDDFADDNFDHAGVGFVGGGAIMAHGSGSVVSGPAIPLGSPQWGAGWQRAMRNWYDRSVLLAVPGHSLAYRQHHLDLDPTYTDAWGHPLLRITFDWRENEHRLAAYLRERMAGILTAMGAAHQTVAQLPERFDCSTYQTTHNTGGAIMGHEPETSVVNCHLQMWDFENVWVIGGSAFPQNGTPGPTGTIGALAYLATEGILRFAGIDAGAEMPT